jgi:hypothetical protein
MKYNLQHTLFVYKITIYIKTLYKIAAIIDHFNIMFTIYSYI